MLLAQALSPIFDLNGRHLGRVDQLMIDIATGKVASVILALGKSEGGERYLSVPWEAVVFDQARDAFLLNLPAETVDDVFDSQHWRGSTDPESDPSGTGAPAAP
jgi:hypothetical protein